MRLAVKFAETNQVIKAKFGEVCEVSDGGYERGYDDGYEKGETDGFKNGHDVGFSDGYETGEEVGYENGHTKGYAEGETAGYENGYSTGYSEGSVYYDQFWDAYQENGERTNYQYSFCYQGWTDETFKPKYDIRPKQIDGMFRYNKITRPMAIMEQRGLHLDFSNATSGQYPFTNSSVVELGYIDWSKYQSFVSAFSSCNELVSIECIKVRHSNSSTYYSGMFTSCEKLQEIRFEGVIGSSMDFKSSPLSIASMKNIISCLENLMGTSYEYGRKISFSDACWANLEADSAAPNGGTWKDYVFSLGWNT